MLACAFLPVIGHAFWIRFLVRLCEQTEKSAGYWHSLFHLCSHQSPAPSWVTWLISFVYLCQNHSADHCSESSRSLLLRAAPSRGSLNHVCWYSGLVMVRSMPSTRRPVLRTRSARRSGNAGVPPACAVRALSYRSARNHRDRPPSGSEHHQALRESGWKGRVYPRPIVPIRSSISSTSCSLRRSPSSVSWRAVMCIPGVAICRRIARAGEFFASFGATATDHSHPTACTADLGAAERRGSVRACDFRLAQRGGLRAVPCTDAHRDGAHEPR